MNYSRIFLFPYSWAIFFLLSGCIACTSPQSHVVNRNAVRLVVETNHSNIEQANLPDPEKDILAGTYISKFFYDGNNQLLKEEKWSSDGILEWREDLLYDKSGDNIERLKYHRDSLVGRTTQEFNSSNRLTRSEEYGAQEQLLVRKSVSYDRSGNSIVTTHESVRKKLIKSIESIYDSSGRLMENRYFRDQAEDGSHPSSLPGLNSWVRKITYLYDAKNNLSQTMEVDSNLVMKSSTSYTYDSLNNTIAIIIQSVDKSRAQTFRYKYQYDENGQWTRRITFLNNHLMSVTIHRISSLLPEAKEANQ
ncbi:MAG: hypothetical protein HYZ44_06365 [Bacteroidetes bacterium]|nr:hypothetical protein [Bacteroidota bacterium]